MLLVPLKYFTRKVSWECNFSASLSDQLYPGEAVVQFLQQRISGINSSYLTNPHAARATPPTKRGRLLFPLSWAGQKIPWYHRIVLHSLKV